MIFWDHYRVAYALDCYDLGAISSLLALKGFEASLVGDLLLGRKYWFHTNYVECAP
jgi:hypothetical protein